MRQCPYDEIQTEEAHCFLCNRPTLELHSVGWTVGEYGYALDEPMPHYGEIRYGNVRDPRDREDNPGGPRGLMQVISADWSRYLLTPEQSGEIARRLIQRYSNPYNIWLTHRD